MTDTDAKEEDVTDELPEHGCCMRVLLLVLSVFGIFILFPTNIFWLAAIIILALCKVSIYYCCCDEHGQMYMEELGYTPIRWFKIVYYGRGYIFPSGPTEIRWRALQRSRRAAMHNNQTESPPPETYATQQEERALTDTSLDQVSAASKDAPPV